MHELEKLRPLFPVTSGDGVFLNHAATSALSQRTIARIQATAAQMEQPLGQYFYNALGTIEETRRKLAELTGCHPRELAFTQNTSTAISLLAQAVRFQPGDRVLVPDDEFPSNRFPWQNLARRGVECTFFKLKRDEPLLATLGAMDLSGVKVIALSAVSYCTGRTHDLAAFAQFCQERGILSCVDAIQAIGAVPFDLHESGIDLMAGAAQKWLLGPVGCGFLYARTALLESLDVPIAGWTSVKYPESFGLMDLDFASEMTRFEPGLPNLLAIAGLNESLRELGDIGWPAIFAAIRAKTAYLENALAARQVDTLAGAEGKAGIASFPLPKALDDRRAAALFDELKIKVTVRDGYVRASPHFYTTQDELDTFLKVFDAVGRKAPVLTPSRPAEALAAKRILLVGATGIVGGHVAQELAQRGFALTLVGRDNNRLAEMKRNLKAGVETATLDVLRPDAVAAFAQELAQRGAKFHGFVYAAGVADAEPFESLADGALEDCFQTNVFAFAKLARAFVKSLRAPDAFGVLTFVSSAGRCGAPLLSSYGASQAALWTLGETIDREVRSGGLSFTTCVAPQMHSRLQKRLGRVALRYFQLSGHFDYDHPDRVAREAVDAFLRRDSLVISRANRIKVLVNALLPDVVNRRIAKVWKA